MLPLLLLVIVVACGGVSAAQVERELYSKLDQGDVAGALALVADDAVFAIPGCPEGGCKGKAAVKGALESVVAQHPRHTVKSAKVTKNTVNSQVEDQLDLAKAAGVERIVLKVSVELKGDKIARYQAQFDTSDPQTATVLNFVRVNEAVQGFLDTFKRGDVPGVMALFTDDIVFQGGAPCQEEPCVGKAQVQPRIERSAANQLQITPLTRQVSENTWKGRSELRDVVSKAAGVDRSITNLEVEVRGDKVSRFSDIQDESDHQTAAYTEFVRLRGLLRQHYDAVNRDDVAGALASLADDAEYVRGARCSPANPCRGKERIQRDALEFDVRFNNRYNITDLQVSGDTATALVEIRGQATRDAGQERQIQIHTVTFKGNKILRLVAQGDTADAQTAAAANFGRVARVALLPTDGVNRSDVAFALDAFADDASFGGFGLCTAAPCVGTGAILKEIKRQVADKTNVTTIPGTARVSGNTHTFRLEIRSDSIKAAGVERVIVTRTTEVPQDKITSLRWQLDTTDPQTAAYSKVALLRQHYDAVNNGDVVAAFAVFTEDALAVRGGRCPLFAPCKGTAIRDELQAEVRNEARFGLLNFQVAGDEGTGRIEFRGLATRNVGLDRLIWSIKATFKGDKIARLIHEWDISDPQTAQFSNYQRVAQVFDVHFVALNRGDVAGAIALYSEDAVFEGWGLCAAAPCRGKAAIQKELERQVADKTTRTGIAAATRVSGDNRTGRAELRSDSVKAAGVERVIAAVTAEVKGDMISSFRYALDATDPRTATYLKSLAR